MGRFGAGEGSGAARTCDSCGRFIRADDDSGLCETCLEVSDGPKYCCGLIYEDGEDTCMSCGEPL